MKTITVKANLLIARILSIPAGIVTAIGINNTFARFTEKITECPSYTNSTWSCDRTLTDIIGNVSYHSSEFRPNTEAFIPLFVGLFLCVLTFGFANSHYKWFRLVDSSEDEEKR